MYCKTCKKNVRSIAHWGKVHPQIRKKALEKARRAKKGRGNAIRGGGYSTMPEPKFIATETGSIIPFKEWIRRMVKR